MKKYEELDITDPFIFAKVMSEKELCKPLLENILNIKIRDIVYVDYEETIQMTAKSKGIRLDIYVEDDDNTVFNLEMQTTTYKELPKRSRYYQGIIDLNMIEKGESYDIQTKNKAPLNALVTGDFVFMNALKRHKFIYVIYK